MIVAVAVSKAWTVGCRINSLKRISKYTPAVTSVEEWTSAETGVGAAMAAGSHAENGICALLVQAAIATSQAKGRVSLELKDQT